jgi:hypothetical protein
MCFFPRNIVAVFFICFYIFVLDTIKRLISIFDIQIQQLFFHFLLNSIQIIHFISLHFFKSLFSIVTLMSFLYIYTFNVLRKNDFSVWLLEKVKLNPYDWVFLIYIITGTREASFVQSINAAGIMYVVTQQCSSGQNSFCTCDNSRNGQSGNTFN